MTNIKTSLLAATATATVLLGASAAIGQTASVAVIDPSASMLGVKAIGPAWKQIGDTYRQAYANAETRQRTLETTVAPLQKKLDTNNDGRLDETEAAAAQRANRPEVQQIVTAQQAAQAEITTLIKPAQMAQVWVLDQVRQKYRAALNSVTTAKKIGLVVTTDAVAFTSPTVDITDDVTAALDATTPTLTIAPPANWQPDQTSVSLYQQFTAALQQAAARQQQAGQAPGAAPRPAGTAPAAPAPTGTKRDRNGDRKSVV